MVNPGPLGIGTPRERTVIDRPRGCAGPSVRLPFPRRTREENKRPIEHDVTQPGVKRAVIPPLGSPLAINPFPLGHGYTAMRIRTSWIDVPKINRAGRRCSVPYTQVIRTDLIFCD